MSPDEAVARIIDRQHGAIAPEQAHHVGMSRGAFRHRVGSGRLVEVFPGSYRARSAPPTFRSDAMAATLSAGEGSVVSDGCAAMLFGMCDEQRGIIEVTVPPDRNPVIDGIIVHRRKLERRDCTTVGPVPVTSVPRTLVDIARSMDRRALAEAVDRALRRKLISPERLDRAVREPRFNRCKGVAVLRDVTADRLRYGVPDSLLEADAFEVLREFALPLPTRQIPAVLKARPVVFDLAYPDKKLAIELDGKGPHSEFPTWQRDHNRHNAVELDDDWRALHFTWWDVHETPVYFACTVADGIGLRPARWRPSG